MGQILNDVLSYLPCYQLLVDIHLFSSELWWYLFSMHLYSETSCYNIEILPHYLVITAVTWKRSPPLSQHPLWNQVYHLYLVCISEIQPPKDWWLAQQGNWLLQVLSILFSLFIIIVPNFMPINYTIIPIKYSYTLELGKLLKTISKPWHQVKTYSLSSFLVKIVNVYG